VHKTSCLAAGHFDLLSFPSNQIFILSFDINYH
jgi:hypothetical protein